MQVDDVAVLRFRVVQPPDDAPPFGRGRVYRDERPPVSVKKVGRYVKEWSLLVQTTRGGVTLRVHSSCDPSRIDQTTNEITVLLLVHDRKRARIVVFDCF